jgi:hypothetical protein
MYPEERPAHLSEQGMKKRRRPAEPRLLSLSL